MHHDMMKLERLTFFSDAVFAIAMTLLVIELRVPHLADRSDTAAWEALGEMIPNFVGFIVSFLVIGAFWANHHRAFGMLARFDPAFVWPNLRFLLVIVFLPFASAFMSDYFGTRVPHLFYTLTLLVAGLAQVHLLRKALRPAYADRDITPESLAALRQRIWAVPIASALAFLIAIPAPAWSSVSLVSISVLTRVLGRERSAA